MASRVYLKILQRKHILSRENDTSMTSDLHKKIKRISYLYLRSVVHNHEHETTLAFRTYGFSLHNSQTQQRQDSPTTTTDARKERVSSTSWHSATHVYVKILQRKHRLSPLHKEPFRITIRHHRFRTIDMDGQNRRISYLYLYPIELRDDENSRRYENQVMLFHLFLTKNKYCVHTSSIVMYSFRSSIFFFFLSIHLYLLILSFSTHTVTLLK